MKFFDFEQATAEVLETLEVIDKEAWEALTMQMKMMVVSLRQRKGESQTF